MGFLQDDARADLVSILAALVLSEQAPGKERRDHGVLVIAATTHIDEDLLACFELCENGRHLAWGRQDLRPLRASPEERVNAEPLDVERGPL